MSSAAELLDASGIGVVTGGASGFGLEAARRCASMGMGVALLDMNVDALASAKAELEELGSADVLTVRCDVSTHEACAEAADAIVAHFAAGTSISFLFNNAGITGIDGYVGGVLGGTPDDSGWRKTFDVNLHGVVNILRVFVPRLVAAGPLPSGRPVQVVTTSSVMGLYDGAMGLSPYNASKMACTSVCEMVYHELQAAGEAAAHVATHSLHPSMAGTGLFKDDAVSQMISDGVDGIAAGLSAADVITSMFAQIGEGRFYCVVDDAKDVPAAEQIRLRMEGQAVGVAPHKAEPMAMLGAVMQAREAVAVPAKANL